MTALHLSNEAACIAFCIFKSAVSRNSQTICDTSNFTICNLAGCSLQNTCQFLQTQNLTEDAVQKISCGISRFRSTSGTHDPDIATCMIRCCDFFYMGHIRVLNHDCFSITDISSGISKGHIIIFPGCCYDQAVSFNRRIGNPRICHIHDTEKLSYI